MPRTPRTPPAAAATPQDHKAKAGPFTFKAPVTTPAAGTTPARTTIKTFTLPSARDATRKVKGRLMRDAAMNRDDGMAQMRLGIATLEASGAPPEAIDALYELDSDAMTDILGAWLNHDDGDGTVPQS